MGDLISVPKNPLAPRGGGSKLDLAMQRKICGYLKQGHHRVTAANLCGLPADRISIWMRKGHKAANYDPKKDPNAKSLVLSKRAQRYRDFYLAVVEAEALAQDSLMQDVKDLAKENGDWRGLAWFLERRYPELWGRKQVQAPAPGATTITTGQVVVNASATTEEYIASMRQAQEQLASPQQQLPAPIDVTPMTSEKDKKNEKPS